MKNLASQTQMPSLRKALLENASRGDLLSWGKEELAFLGTDEATASTERLLAEAAGLDRHQIYLEPAAAVAENHKRLFKSWIQKRKSGVPAAYIIGKSFFWNEVLEVGPGCLIPRPETEILIERFIAETGFEKTASFSFLDLCTGSGAIGVSLLRHFSAAKAALLDVSQEALQIAEKNLKRYELLSRSELVLSNLFTQVEGRKWNAILCNPPYFAAKDWQDVQSEILCEPSLALDGGQDGLMFYREIIAQAGKYLLPNGWLWMEIGRGQAETEARVHHQR